MLHKYIIILPQIRWGSELPKVSSAYTWGVATPGAVSTKELPGPARDIVMVPFLLPTPPSIR